MIRRANVAAAGPEAWTLPPDQRGGIRSIGEVLEELASRFDLLPIEDGLCRAEAIFQGEKISASTARTACCA